MKILITAAIKNEFPFCKDYKNILYTGIGKTNASISLLEYLSKNKNIDIVINIGSAAGILCKKNDIIECGTFLQGDLDYPNYKLEKIVFNKLKYTIATFDSFQTKIPKRQCNCIDMESFALAKICKIKKIKFICYKYISDIIGEESQNEEWINNCKKGKDNLKEIVDNLIKKYE